MIIYKKFPLERTGGYVRITANGDWAWKCLDCSTKVVGFDFKDDAEEDLWEHKCGE